MTNLLNLPAKNVKIIGPRRNARSAMSKSVRRTRNVRSFSSPENLDNNEDLLA